MRAVADPTLPDRFAVEVDPSAEPVDVDAALARFLLAVVRRQRQADQDQQVKERQTA